MGYNPIFNPELHMPKNIHELNISFSDIKGLRTKSLIEMDHTGELESVILSKIGGYDGQTLRTILCTKLWDLDQGLTFKELGMEDLLPKDSEIQKKPICLWAFNRAKLASLPNSIREFPPKKGSDSEPDSKRPLFTDKRSHYVLMPLTSSLAKAGSTSRHRKVGKREEIDTNLNPKVGEEIGDFYARFDTSGLRTVDSLTLEDREPYQYPSKDNLNVSGSSKRLLFPEIADTATHAFLVSGLFLTEECVGNKFLDAYRHFKVNMELGNVASKSFRGQFSTGGIKRIENSSLSVYANETCLDTDFTGNSSKEACQRWIIACIEYPYIVRIESTVKP